MKLQVVSDLHLEFPQAVIDLNNAGSDVLILGGDINTAAAVSRYPEYMLQFFKDCSERWKHVIYLMGNHEHYHGYFDETVLKLRKQLSCFKNIHILDKEEVVIEGVPFFGATLWTDCNGGDKRTQDELMRGMNDYRRIMTHGYKFSTRDTITEHKKTLVKLQEFIEKYRNDKVVVCTHHSPSKRSLHPKYLNDVEMNGGYQSELEWVMLKYPNIALWTHGHTHDSFDYKVNETRIVCNPAGYQMLQGVYENLKFEIDKIVEV